MDPLLEATARAERDHFWFRGFRRFVRPLLDRAAAGRAGLRLLDCGCGTGNNLAMLRRYGRAAGIDTSPTGLAYARASGERLVARASVTSLPFSAASFDIVTSFDVLYALEDDLAAAALAEMHRVLAPGGHAIINVAALPFLRGNHSVLGGEVQRYTRAGLRRHLSRAGFEIQRLTYTNATLFPIMAGVRLVQRVAGLHASSRELTVPAGPVNAAFSTLLAAEAAAVQFVNMPIGSSLLALARRGATSRPHTPARAAG